MRKHLYRSLLCSLAGIVLLVSSAAPGHAWSGGGGHGGGSGGGGWHGGGGWQGGGGWHGGGWGWRGGFWGPRVFVGGAFWDPWGYGYPYAYPYPAYAPPVVEQAPPVYTQQAPPAQYWYYCQNPQGYYPYVGECTGGWLQVAPQPTPAPQAQPLQGPPPR